MNLRLQRIVLSVGVVTVIIVIGSMQIQAQTMMGLRYWLPVDVAVVDALVTTTIKTEIEESPDVGKPGSWTLKPVSHTDVERTGTLSIRTVADLATESYVVDITAGRLRDTSIGVEVSSGGLLRSVSPSSVGRAGEVIQTIARFAGTAASLASGLPFVPVLVGANPQLRGTPVSKCDPFAAPFATQPIRVRALAAASEEACTLLVEIFDRQAALGVHEQTRLRLELQIDTAADADLPALKIRLASTKGAIKATQAEMEARQTRFSALLEAFVREKKLGTQVKTEHFATVLSLADLKETTTSLPVDSPVRKFFTASGLLITAGPIRAPNAGTVKPMPQKEKTVRIAFRQSEPWRFRLEASTDPMPNIAAVTLVAESLADVILPSGQVSFVDFESSAFSQRKLAVTFDDRGRPIRLERTGTSAGAALATAVSDASRSARDEYANGLSKLVEIQTSEQKLRIDSISAKIDELKKQKELLDARLSVEGATQNFDTLLQQQQLQAELGLLTAQQNQIAAATTADQRLEIEALKVQLDQLKAQVDILKAQQELTKLRANQ